jgi:ribosomal protein S18 acetylase RimI-like enzyme
MTVTRIPLESAPEAIAVLCDAFHDYPAMRFILGDEEDYDTRLRTLIGLFVMARLAKRGPVLGIRDEGGELLGVATLTARNEPAPPGSFGAWREQIWKQLGNEARLRYEMFSDLTPPFERNAPGFHLNMIGVRRSHHGRGLGRLLLDAVHVLSDGDPVSFGVTLNTEQPANVALYEKFGYRVMGRARISPELESWGMFRERPAAG